MRLFYPFFLLGNPGLCTQSRQQVMQWTNHVKSSGKSHSSLLSSTQSHSILSHLRLVAFGQNLKIHFRTIWKLNDHTNCM